jgi:hypothetical protein
MSVDERLNNMIGVFHARSCAAIVLEAMLRVRECGGID